MRKGARDGSLKNFKKVLSKEGKLEIRPAKKEDLPALLELDKVCIKEEKFNKKQWEYLLRKAKSVVFTASIDGNIIGTIVVLLRKHIVARIYILNVHPAHRRSGIGSLLMDTTLKFLKDRRYKKVTIETGINNQAALNLYKSKGFSVDKILKRYYKSGEDANHLVLMLTNEETKRTKIISD